MLVSGIQCEAPDLLFENGRKMRKNEWKRTNPLVYHTSGKAMFV